jgi:hypothetical protein
MRSVKFLNLASRNRFRESINMNRRLWRNNTPKKRHYNPAVLPVGSYRVWNRSQSSIFMGIHTSKVKWGFSLIHDRVSNSKHINTGYPDDSLTNGICGGWSSCYIHRSSSMLSKTNPRTTFSGNPTSMTRNEGSIIQWNPNLIKNPFSIAGGGPGFQLNSLSDLLRVSLW